MGDSKMPGMPGVPGLPVSTSSGLSRRQFLQGAAVGAVGAVAVSSGVAAIMWPDATSAPAEAPAAPTPAPGTPTPAPTQPMQTASLPSFVTPPRDTGYIMVDATKCVGCRLCESECAIAHEGVPNLTRSRIKIHYYNPPVDVPIVCQQCADAPCMEACPPKVAAISKDEATGALIIDENKCTGCGLCVDACRTGTIRLDEEALVAVGICDLCGGEQPACIGVCPSGALVKTSTSTQGAYWAAKPADIARQAAQRLYHI